MTHSRSVSGRLRTTEFRGLPVSPDTDGSDGVLGLTLKEGKSFGNPQNWEVET